MSDSVGLSLGEYLEKEGFLEIWKDKARAKGLAEGKEREALSIAQNMIDLGLPMETIVSATRLDPEKIKALKW